MPGGEAAQYRAGQPEYCTSPPNKSHPGNLITNWRGARGLEESRSAPASSRAGSAKLAHFIGFKRGTNMRRTYQVLSFTPALTFLRLKALRKSLLVRFCVSLLLAGSVSAQSNAPLLPLQNDNLDTPFLRQRAREHIRQGKSGLGAGRRAPEKDDPRARLEWQRHERGLPSAAFKQHMLNLERAHAASQAQARAALKTGSGTQSPVWVPIGPTGGNYIQNGNFTAYVEDSGRARAILPSPVDANTVYFLTSGGGLWVTHNFTSNPAAWTPLTDTLPTTGGGSVAFGRSSNVLYLGLGDPFDLINTAGVMFESSDGGTTWTNSVALTNAMSVRDVKVDTSAAQDIILVATDFGLFRSVDGGVSYAAVTGFGFDGQSAWSLVQTSAGWLLNAQPCGSMVPAVACGNQSTIYISTDHGATWAPISNAGNVFTGTGRTTLADGAPGDSIVYAFAENVASTDQADLFRSTDGGQSWAAIGLNSRVPTNPNSDNPNMDLMHDQAYYNQMVLVDPRDPARNTVYLGGNLSSAKSSDGGNTWTLLSNWVGGGTFSFGLPPYVHSDFHAAALSTAGTATLMFGSDGGLFASSDGGATWSDKNNGLQTFLFYSLTSTPVFPSAVMAASQDNGTLVRNGNTTIYNQSSGGDGIGTGWSQANANVATTSAEFNQYVVNWTNQLPDSILNFFPSLTPLVNDAAFYTPVEVPTASLDPSGKIFFTSSLQLIDETTDGGNTFSVIGQVGFNGIPSSVTLRPDAHSVAVSPLDLLHVAVGGASGHIEISTNGGTSWTDVSIDDLLPGFKGYTGSVTWADNNTIYVTSVAPTVGAVRVAKSVNGGISWARADNGLPDVPTPRVIIDRRDATNNSLLAASDLGIYQSTDGGANWAPYDSGMPNVAVSDIYMPADGSFLRAATYGRGIWELPFLAFTSATLTDDVISCDHDGVLDNGETGHLTITLHNGGVSSLNSVSATITSTNPNVTFPNGNSISFPVAAAASDTTAAVAVSLNGASGIQQIDFTLAFTDPALNLLLPVNALASFRANTDEIPNGSANDDMEANNSAWTISGTPQVLPDIVSWQRRQITPLEHRWAGVDSNLASDESLISPVMQVGAASFTIAFEQRYSFDFLSNQAWYDGMVLEISTDGGSSWSDIGQYASPGYDHVLASGGGNVLQGRMAYTGLNDPPYPAFTPVAVSLGTQFAGQSVQMRFRVGTDFITGLPGVEIRNITTTGLTNTPFTALVADRGMCATTTSLSSNLNPSSVGQTVTFAASVSGGLTIPTGALAFRDGTVTIGTSTLDSFGQTSVATSTLAAGIHNMTGVYGGDASHAASTSAVLLQTVTHAATSTALASSANPSVFNQSVTFTATVTSGSGTPTGTVTFFDGANSLGTVALSGGVGSLSISALAVGSHSITASYSGDSTFNSSTSSALIQNVNKASTTVQLGSSLNPSGFGQSVSFTATIFPQFSGQPTGLVTFLDGTTSIASIGVTNSRAILSTSALAVGTHSITASYSGDSNFTGNVSSPLSQVVNTSTSTFTTLVNFNGTNGGNPLGGLVQSTDGNLYGTTSTSGSGKNGTVFRVSPNGSLRTLHNFSGTDGSSPTGALVLATNGMFYGTTTNGGSGGSCYNACGTVFKITAAGGFTSLYSFSGTGDGSQPAGLIQAANGNFYGTTYGVGSNGYGTVFKITSAGSLTTLYTFCAKSGCTDGANPAASLVQGTDGNFYGTTAFGGNGGHGTIFKITSAGVFTLLHSFCLQFNKQGYCSDGFEPRAGLVQGADGNFYGTTSADGNGLGTVFQITPGSTFTTLYYFGSNSTDGGKPNAALIQATDGNFYGVTDAFGANGDGTIFEITPGGTETTLYSFTAVSSLRTQELVQASDGNFYGTTDSGGIKGDGTVFKLAMGLAPFVKTQPTSGKVGAAVKIFGTNLTGATSVSFNGTPATFTVVSSSEITTTVPAGATTGTVQVATPGGTLTTNVVFRVTPVITGFTPPSGLVGTQVTINGVSLTQTGKVTFGGVNATAFTVNSDTQVTATVPKGARTGRIAITTPGGTATSATSFTVTP
jgi:uncharacterized repeat protein (TIGR03803 family)